MIHLIVKSDGYHGDKEPVSDLGVAEVPMSLSPPTDGRRRRVRRLEVIRGPHVAKPTLLTVEHEAIGDYHLFLTTKAAREVAKGLLQNMTLEEVVADQELVSILRAMLSDVNNFGK